MDALILCPYQNKDKKYLTFSNRDGKRWSIPLKNMRMGLEIYEPSGTKGKLLKKFLPLASKLGFAKSILRGSVMTINFHPRLIALMNQLFGSEWECSIFWGTPCIDQKATLQIYRDRKILGYCKIGSSERVINLFLHEKTVLSHLEQKKIQHVPRCLEVQQISDHSWIFIQTTEKTNEAKVKHQYGKIQEEFLEHLYVRTKVPIMFEQTDYYASLCFLKQHLTLLPLCNRDKVNQLLNRILELYRDQTVEWGVYHRDFTPWNTCKIDGHLFAFDFEYALLHAPQGLDRWHFFVQTKFLEKKWSSEQVLNAYRNLPEHEKSDEQFICYLLDIISLYLQRGQKDDLLMAKQRAELLE